MAGFDEFDSSAKLSIAFSRSSSLHSTTIESPKKPYADLNASTKKLYNLTSVVKNTAGGMVKKLCNTFESAGSSENSNSPISPLKPLSKLLTLEESSVLADKDPTVVPGFRRAQSSRQLGFNQSRTMRSVESGSRVSSLFDYGIRLPGTEDRIVLYFTSLRGIRRTYEDCCTVRTIFNGFRVHVDERDISMDSAYRKELKSVLGEKTLTLPQIFIRGKYIGGADEIKQLHEVGELSKLLVGFPVRDPRFVCDSCGDARFLPCLNCNGSRKVFDEEEEQLRRCLECNENGLIRCLNCCY